MNSDGTEPRRLARGGWPSWSNDSKSVYYHSRVDNALYSISIEGLNVEPKKIMACSNSFPSLSPDNRRVAYLEDRSLKVKDLVSQTVVTQWPFPFPAWGGASWSPTGQEICLGGSKSDDATGLWIFSLDTNELARTLDGQINIGSSYYDSMPCISPDGLELFFNSNRPGGSGMVDLWVATRTTKTSTWTSPVNLGPVVNSIEWEQHPTISSDGLTLIFESHRPGYGGDDIWSTTRISTHDPWTSPKNLGPTINTPYNEFFPRLSSDDKVLLFTSDNLPGGLGKMDIWMSRRASPNDQWSVPVVIGSAKIT